MTQLFLLLPLFASHLTVDTSTVKPPRIPVYFEPNRGQFDPAVRFRSREANYVAWITDNELVLDAYSSARKVREVSRIRFAGTRKPKAATGLDAFPGVSNYYLGNDPSKWVTGVPNYAKAKLEEIYPGIDVVFYADGRSIEYDFIVKPGADASQIRVEFPGKNDLQMEPKGLITLRTPNGVLKQLAPKVYQGGVEIAANPRLEGRTLRFGVNHYDPSQELRIDPTVLYSTFFGGSNTEYLWDQDAKAIVSKPAVDSTGALALAGLTMSTNYPVVAAHQASNAGQWDTVVTKLNPAGSSLVFSTYLGGSNFDQGRGIAIDSSDNLYVLSITQSSNFPVTAGVVKTTHTNNARGGAVTKLSSSGTMVFSTYNGNSAAVFEPRNIAVNASGEPIVLGWGTGFAPMVNSQKSVLGGTQDAILFKLNSTGTAYQFSTYYGSANTGNEVGVAIALDAVGDIYITGNGTGPATLGAYQNGVAAPTSGNWVAKYTGAGALVWATTIGKKANDWVGDIAVDASNQPVIVGRYLFKALDDIINSWIWPTTSGAYSTTGTSTCANSFVTKLAADGSALVWSTFLGNGTNWCNTAQSVTLDASGNVWVAGLVGGTGSGIPFPTTADAIQSTKDSLNSVTLAKLNPTGSALLFGTFYGGNTSSEDAMGITFRGGKLYLTARTNNTTGFPKTSGSYTSPTSGADEFAAVALSFDASLTITSSPAGLLFTGTGACAGANQMTPVVVPMAPAASCTVTFGSPQLGPGAGRFVFSQWENSSTNASRTFSGITANTTATGTFTLEYPLNTSVIGSGTITPATGANFYPSGTVVNVTATPGPNFTFTGWTGACTGTGPCSVTMNSAKAVTANFAPQSFVLTTAVSPAGAGSISPATGPATGTVNVTQSPVSGYRFTGWTGACSGTGPCLVNMDAAKSVTANYIQQFVLTTAASPVAGGTVAPPTGPVDAGTVVSVTAITNPGYRFTGWTGACTGTGPCSVTVDAAKSVTANFVQQFVLTTAASPVAGGTVAPASGLQDSGTVVTVTATANPGYRFTGWTGACTGSGACSVTVDAAKTVTANFIQQFVLTTDANPVAGGVVSPASGAQDSGAVVNVMATPNPGYRFAGWSGACTGSGACSVTIDAAKSVTANFVQQFVLSTDASPVAGGVVSPASGAQDSGAVVNVTATPNPGYRFTGWSGACTGSGACSVTIDAAKSVTANFVQQFVLTTDANPVAGGTVTPSSGTYDSGTVVSVSAVANSGYRFTGWSGACTGTGVCSVTVDAAKTVTANFVQQFTLSATVTGGGTVTGTSLNCLSSCSVAYDNGTILSLTATANSGFTFAGWGGACTGTGTCSVTMDSAKSVTATFTMVAPAIAVTLPGKTGTIGGTRNWTLRFTNSGGGTAVGLSLNSFVLTQTAGTTCSPTLSTAMPVALGDVTTGNFVNTTVSINFTGCSLAARFRLDAGYSSNGGSYSNTFTVANQIQ